MEKLAEKNKGRVIDVLTERLAFERSGVKLYERVIGVMRSSKDPNMERMLGPMVEHQTQEKEHEEWLEAQIRTLGGDAHGETEKSRLITRESQGIEAVIKGDSQLPHLFHALLAAELVDNAGWDLSVQLADEAGDREAKRQFKKRLREEAEHLLFVRKAVEKFSIHEVFGKEVKMPSSGLGAALS
jgi:bacterioferritin (cytochrome b1)